MDSQIQMGDDLSRRVVLVNAMFARNTHIFGSLMAMRRCIKKKLTLCAFKKYGPRVDQRDSLKSNLIKAVNSMKVRPKVQRAILISRIDRRFRCTQFH